jgi:hypothetical protein
MIDAHRLARTAAPMPQACWEPGREAPCGGRIQPKAQRLTQGVGLAHDSHLLTELDLRLHGRGRRRAHGQRAWRCGVHAGAAWMRPGGCVEIQ